MVLEVSFYETKVAESEGRIAIDQLISEATNQFTTQVTNEMIHGGNEDFTMSVCQFLPKEN